MTFRNTIPVLLLTLTLLGTCSGASTAGAIYRAGVVYKVGDSDGRGFIANYDNWTSTKTFHVGDTLVFTYNNSLLDLMEVSGQDYDSCNTKSPVAVYAIGSDVINLNQAGDYYFIGGRNFEPEWYAVALKDPSYCHAGQKLHVKVAHPIPNHHLVASPGPAPTPSSLYHGQPTSTSAAAPNLSVLPCLFIPLILLFFFRNFYFYKLGKSSFVFQSHPSIKVRVVSQLQDSEQCYCSNFLFFPPLLGFIPLVSALFLL